MCAAGTCKMFHSWPHLWTSHHTESYLLLVAISVPRIPPCGTHLCSSQYLSLPIYSAHESLHSWHQVYRNIASYSKLYHSTALSIVWHQMSYSSSMDNIMSMVVVPSTQNCSISGSCLRSLHNSCQTIALQFSLPSTQNWRS